MNYFSNGSAFDDNTPRRTDAHPVPAWTGWETELVSHGLDQWFWDGLVTNASDTAIEAYEAAPRAE